ncbi:unnamed protein product [Effrenium voratum]|nr:unnamed protein product [Effrenium voratum]
MDLFSYSPPLTDGPVFITDNEPELLQLMEKNIQANRLGHCVESRLLDWADDRGVVPQPDLVVAADVLYQGDGSMFCDALSRYLATTAEAYVANHHNPDRCEATLGFLRRAAALGLQVERLQDGAGFALGSLAGSFEGSFEPFRGAEGERLASVQHARFHQPGGSPTE